MSLPIVMLVDRNFCSASPAREALQPFAGRVDAFDDPERALEAFRRQPATYDAVVCDALLCSLSGLELAAELRALRPAVPIVLTAPASVHGFLEDLQEKPFSRVSTREDLVKSPGRTLAGLLGEGAVASMDLGGDTAYPTPRTPAAGEALGRRLSSMGSRFMALALSLGLSTGGVG